MGSCRKRSKRKNESVVSKNSVQETRTTIDNLADDLLLIILDKLDVSDRISLSQACKEWRRVEGLHRSTLRLPYFRRGIHLHNFLKRFPNLLKLGSPAVIPNSLIRLLPKKCPSMKVLNLGYEETETDVYYDSPEFDDFDDSGLSYFATRFYDIQTIVLTRRNGVGDLGVVSLVVSCRHLRNLDLGWCRKVSDLGLESIGCLEHLKTLNLEGCCLITDVGLGFLAMGFLRLEKLSLAECTGITDCGLAYLKKMCCLEELDLSGCGPKVKTGVAEMSPSLKKLNLSYLPNVSDVCVSALARNCWNLRVLYLTGCEKVSASDILAFSIHNSIRYIEISKGLKLPRSLEKSLKRRGCTIYRP